MAEKEKKLHEYRPTQNELKLIEALCDPANREKNITEICELVGISRRAYYNMFAKPEFVEYYRKVQFEAVRNRIAQVLQSTIKFAIENPKCHQDRKMLLEMASMYTPKQELDANIANKDGRPFEVQHSVDLRKLSADELKQLEAILLKAENASKDS